MTPKNPQLIFTDAAGFAENEQRALVMIHIERQNIESRNLASTIERLLTLTDSRENVIRYRESVLFFTDGYDDDPRELQEIPEVRAFFRALVDEWPHWIWYLQRGTGSIALLFALLCEVEVIRGPEGQRGTAFKSVDEISAVMLDLLARGLHLFYMYQLPGSELDASAMSALAELGILDESAD